MVSTLETSRETRGSNDSGQAIGRPGLSRCHIVPFFLLAHEASPPSKVSVLLTHALLLVLSWWTPVHEPLLHTILCWWTPWSRLSYRTLVMSLIATHVYDTLVVSLVWTRPVSWTPRSELSSPPPSGWSLPLGSCSRERPL